MICADISEQHFMGDQVVEYFIFISFEKQKKKTFVIWSQTIILTLFNTGTVYIVGIGLVLYL